MPHLTAAVSEKALKAVFDAMLEKFTHEDTFSGSLGIVSASLHVKFHLERGAIDLRAGNTFFVDELDIKWDIFDLTLAFDIPEMCIGGFCIIPNPFGGCLVELPEWCLFSASPELSVTLPLGGFTTEVTMEGKLVAKHFLNPDRGAGMNDWDAQETDPPVTNAWRIHLDPIWVDLDAIDLPDTIGDLLDAALTAAIDTFLFFLPQDIKDAIEFLFGSIVDFIRGLLDIPDDIAEWISDILNIGLTLEDFIGHVLIENFANDNPLFSIEDPLPILPEADNPNGSGLPKLVDVKLPIQSVNVFNDDVELVIEANLS